MNNRRSRDYYDRAMRLVPEQTMTFAKAAHNYPSVWAPRYVKAASGCEVVDVDDNRFIDYTMALGPVILGYNYPRITRAVMEQLACGTIFSLPHYLEVELAEVLERVIPCCEQVRFYKNGADVTGLAIRLARSYTGRRHVLQSGYHGHHDWYSWVLREGGTLKELKQYTHSFAYNDLAGVQQLIDRYRSDIAAIIVETAFDPPRDEFLHKLRRLCDAHGIVYIFDEMWTGFRFGLGGFQEFIDVTPDIGLFSKAVANGFPISLIAGKRVVMDHFGRLWGFTTFGGEILSIRAALETICEIEERDVVKYVHCIGAQLKGGLAEILKESGHDATIGIVGYDCRFKLTVPDSTVDHKLCIQEQFLRDGILWNNMFVTSFSHQPVHVDRTLESFRKAVRSLG